MYKKDGLCLDENTSNTVSVLVEDTSICSSICQGMSKNAGLTNKSEKCEHLIYQST